MSSTEIKQNILLDLIEKNRSNKIACEALENLIEEPNLWTISGIDFKVPPKGSSKEFNAKFEPKFNNIKYSGNLLIKIRLTNF